MPSMRVWSRGVKLEVEGMHAGDHTMALRDSRLSDRLRRMSVDGGVGQARLASTELRDSSADPGVDASTEVMPLWARARYMAGLGDGDGAGVRSLKRQFVTVAGEAKKLSSPWFAAICGLLRQHPRAVLVMKAPAQAEALQRVVAEASARGVSPHRVLFMHGFVAMARFVERLMAADVILDTFPFGAHSLLVSPATLGVPVVGLRGAPQIGRVGPGLSNQVERGMRVLGGGRSGVRLLQGWSMRDCMGLASRVLSVSGLGRGMLRARLGREALMSGFLSDGAMASSLGRATSLMWDVRAFQVDGVASRVGIASERGVGGGGVFPGHGHDSHAAGHGADDGMREDAACCVGGTSCAASEAFDRVLRVRLAERPARSMLLGWLAMHVVVDPEASGRSGTAASDDRCRVVLGASREAASVWARGEAEGYRRMGEGRLCANALLRSSILRGPQDI